MLEFGKSAQARGVKVIIAAAGGAAHLPGMLASVTTLPVIGVPVALKDLAGLDSLLSIAQMPAGVPVATVGISNSKNAALLALRILATSDEILDKKLKDFAERQKQLVKDQNNNLN
jgi:5-(carboxyamino)imidazole ribonucleotide mutase